MKVDRKVIALERSPSRRTVATFVLEVIRHIAGRRHIPRFTFSQLASCGVNVIPPYEEQYSKEKYFMCVHCYRIE